MTEYCLFPSDVGRKVTGFTVRGKSRVLMVWIVSRIVVVRMTGVTIRGQNVALGMALLTIKSCVCTLEKPKGVMIELGSFPSRGRVAVTRFAVRWKASLLMIWIIRPVIV